MEGLNIIDDNMCRVDGCTRSAKHKKSRLCQAHYLRFWRNGAYDLIPDGRERRRQVSRKPDAVTNRVVRWYRLHGNSCEFSVWKLISLVNGALGRDKINASDVEIAKYYASKVSYDLDMMDGMEKWR